jgi:serine/threonine-protein kinase RsbT
MSDPATETGETLVLTSEADVVRVRQAVRAAAVGAALSLVDQTKLVTATSELARNTLVYGGGGRVTVSLVDRERRKGVQVAFIDEGPGIPDVDQAMTDGWTSGSGLGLGLSGAKRLVDEFELETAPGEGTTVRVTKWKR